jgi:hypothetical protein
MPHNQKIKAMLYRMLCNGVRLEGVKVTPGLGSELYCCVHYTPFDRVSEEVSANLST